MPQAILDQLRQMQRAREVHALQLLLDAHPELSFSEEPAVQACVVLCKLNLGHSDATSLSLAAIDAEELSADPDALSDLAMAHVLAGEVERGLDLLQKATSSRANCPAIAFQRLASVLVLLNKLEEATTAFEESLRRDPNHPEILSNLGGLNFRQGDLESALDHYNRAIAIKPTLANEATGQQRSRVLLALERVDELIAEKLKQLNEDPQEPNYHLQLANVLQLSDRHAEAKATLEASLDRFPEERSVRLSLIKFYFDQKLWGPAGQWLKRWCESDPDDLDLRLLLNQVRIEAGFLEAARKDLEDIHDQAAGLPLHALLQAQILVHESRADEALELLELACDRFPGDMGLVQQRGEVLTSLGRLSEAEELLQAFSVHNPLALARRIEAAGHKADDSQTEALIKLTQNPQLLPQQRSSLLFTLAQVLEKQKRYDESFNAAADANAILSPSLGYRWQKHRALIDETIRTFTPELVERLQGYGHPSERPIFITGMPRSGTTLSEQILCSHHRVYGAGELPWMPQITQRLAQLYRQSHLNYPELMNQLTPDHLYDAGDYYLQKVASQNNSADRVVDKLPHNFDYIGLIALALPNATIIHLKRDERDIAVSNFYQNFAAAHGLMGFAFSLEDIGHMLNDHRRIMDHWHQIFPGRIFELSYQQLVSDPEPTIRSLLEHCKLEWDPQVLKFYETSRPVRTASIRQVREGFYTSSTEKWRRYSQFLAPLEAVLAEGYKALDDAEAEALGAGLLAAGITR